LLQETFGDSVPVVKTLKSLFSGWMFATVDARGRLGGLATGWKKTNCNLEIFWGFASGIGLTILSTDLGRSLTIINVYGPYQDRQRYWNSLAECSWFRGKDLILGGDLNFSLGASKLSGQHDALITLTNLFLNFLDQIGLVDIEPQKLPLTWCNRRIGDDMVNKRLEKNLLSEEVLDSFDLVRQWVTYGGESDHFSIMLELRDRSKRVSIPSKFFEGWISNPSYQELVRGLWSSITDGN